MKDLGECWGQVHAGHKAEQSHPEVTSSAGIPPPICLSPCIFCCCCWRAREQRGWSWLWCFMSPLTSLNRLPSFETRARTHCPPSRQLFRWSSTFWKRSPQSWWVIYRLFSQPERGVRDARHGNLPLELAGEGLGLGCSVAPLHMAVGGWCGVRHLCFCPRSSHVTAVPCSPELEEENLHQTKGCEGLCVYRWEARLRCPPPTFHIHPVDASGRWGGRAPATRDTNTLWLCMFAIKIGTWEPLCLGKKIKLQPWLPWCSPALNQNYCSPLRIPLTDTNGSRCHDLRFAQLRFVVNKDQMFIQLCFWLRPVEKK